MLHSGLQCLGTRNYLQCWIRYRIWVSEIKAYKKSQKIKKNCDFKFDKSEHVNHRKTGTKSTQFQRTIDEWLLILCIQDISNQKHRNNAGLPVILITNTIFSKYKKTSAMPKIRGGGEVWRPICCKNNIVLKLKL